MDLYEFNTHPFVVKVWLETQLGQDDQVSWRGSITHVPTGKQKYFQDLHEISDFIEPYLQDLGVKFKTDSQLRLWLKRLGGYFGHMVK